MTDTKDIQHKLEEGVENLRDGADTLFKQASAEADKCDAGQGCAALEAVRDNIIDRPLLSIGLSGILGVVVGALLKRKC